MTQQVGRNISNCKSSNTDRKQEHRLNDTRSVLIISSEAEGLSVKAAGSHLSSTRPRLHEDAGMNTTKIWTSVAAPPYDNLKFEVAQLFWNQSTAVSLAVCLVSNMGPLIPIFFVFFALQIGPYSDGKPRNTTGWTSDCTISLGSF